MSCGLSVGSVVRPHELENSVMDEERLLALFANLTDHSDPRLEHNRVVAEYLLRGNGEETATALRKLYTALCGKATPDVDADEQEQQESSVENREGEPALEELVLANLACIAGIGAV
jgi:hypothetical protein